LNMTPEDRQYASLFIPFALSKIDNLQADGTKFVHYTTAETAMSIIQTRRVWMRNAKTMNDFSEIEHGKRCLFPAYKDEAIGGRLRAFMNNIYPNFSQRLETLFNGWLPHFEQDTYLTSLSEHDSSEDLLGRLSMWRAYCPRNGVALVISTAPFTRASDSLKAYSSPMSYLSPQHFGEEFSKLIDNLITNEQTVRTYSEDKLLGSVFTMFKFAILCTKHPGFAEEREWRILYSPTQELSPVIESGFATVQGIPQEIYKIPLTNDPENGLFQADIPNLLQRIIIGPTQQPFTIWRAFRNYPPLI